MKTPPHTRRGALCAAFATITAFFAARTVAAPRSRWRKLGPDETIQPGDRYASRDPHEIAQILSNPLAFEPGTAEFFTCRVFPDKEIGQKPKNIFILDPSAGYWRFE
jgi:hypothetical protein